MGCHTSLAAKLQFEELQLGVGGVDVKSTAVNVNGARCVVGGTCGLGSLIDFQLSHLVITLCSLAILLCYLLVELPLSHLMIIKKNFNCSHFILAVSSNSLGTTESTSAVSPEEYIFRAIPFPAKMFTTFS